MTSDELLKEADFIIKNFKSHYLNEAGLVSRTFPVSESTIFAHFDDIAPFFIYFRETDFLLSQMRKLKQFSFDAILSEKNMLYSYRIDEYLGGLFSVWKTSKNRETKILLDDAVKKTIEYFFYENNFFGTYNTANKKRGLYYYYWSSGVLETFLEMAQECPELQSRVINIVDLWLKNKFYLKHGLFPFRQTENKIVKMLNAFSSFFKVFFRHHPGMAGKGFASRIKCKAKSFIFNYFSSGNFAVLMKSNTTFIFLLMELHQLTKDEKYKSAVVNWINTVSEKLYKNGIVFGTYYSNGKTAHGNLVNSFIFVDVLLDAYFLIEKNPDYLKLAKQIIDNRLKDRWENGLIPINLSADKNDIDNQVDFSISMRRYGEAAGDKAYLEKSLQLMEKTLKIHKADKGYYRRVNSKGQGLNKDKVNAIDPKYNGLLLKGIINMLTIEKNMYNNPVLHDLFKDR